MQRLSIAGVSTRDSGAQLLEPVEHDLDAHQLREVAVHDLNRDLSVVAEVVREKNVRHSAGADLPLNGVAICQGRLQTIKRFHSDGNGSHHRACTAKEAGTIGARPSSSSCSS